MRRRADLAYLPATANLSRSRMLREEERSIPRRGDAPILYKMRKERPPTFNRLVPATSRTNIRNTRFPTRVAERQLSVLLTQLKSELAWSFAGVGFSCAAASPDCLVPIRSIIGFS
jgi:hypothetical protein